ncbi:MAG: hypothetical protein COC22_06810 [Flavobacteriaceae bacterium]|nr:MAG: hypothetical protein COC22_06810 [Flavobacteriaceae bacterium]
MDKPLTKWYCDVCGEKIENINQGYVIWKSTEDMKNQDYKIIHQTKCDIKAYPASAALEDFIGDEGLAYLLSKLSIGPIKEALSQGSYCQIRNNDEFVDFMRRVQTPFYEEARRHFKNPDLLENYCDSNEVSPYCPSDLKQIIKNYG